MPSDAKKKRDAKKKEALKKRDQKKPPKTGDGEPDENHSSENGYDQTNGVAGREHRHSCIKNLQHQTLLIFYI